MAGEFGGDRLCVVHYRAVLLSPVAPGLRVNHELQRHTRVGCAVRICGVLVRPRMEIVQDPAAEFRGSAR